MGTTGAVYLVRGGLQTCDSSNNCTGGLTQPKAGEPPWSNTILQVDALGNYTGQFPWPVNPGYVDIKSSGGATVTMAIPTVNQ